MDDIEWDKEEEEIDVTVVIDVRTWSLSIE